jgi:hypothetical protein
VLDGARMRMARKPSALARELLRNFPKGKRKRGGRRRKRKGGGSKEAGEATVAQTNGQAPPDAAAETDSKDADSTDVDEPGDEPAARDAA